MARLIRPCPQFPGRRTQRGAVAVMVAAMIFVILGVCGMAIDLSFMYNRRVEMQNLADAAALAAGAELNGTSDGVARAIDRAAAVAATFHYNYSKKITWSEGALSFSTAPARTGTWVDAGAARTAADGLLFARVDTLQLKDNSGLVRTLFMDVLGSSKTASMQGFAIAGRTGVKVAPIAICALSNTAAQARTTSASAGKELVEFGFRRGVSYNLMKLNPGGITEENFVINPFAPPDITGGAAATTPDVVSPYVCNGTMAMARVTGGKLTVTRPFPVSDLVTQLNSRFNDYTGNTCSPVLAPPDTNIKNYAFASIAWMATKPTGQSAALITSTTALITVADVSPAPAGNTADRFGPLWSFAKAVPFSAFVEGQPEPAGGYSPFPVGDWPKLYDPGQPTAKSYPELTPYLGVESSQYTEPIAVVRPQDNRRVLNVALLRCPVDAGTTVTATALGVG